MNTQFNETIYEMAKALDARKAEDILLINVTKSTILADYFIIASGRATTHVQTLADELEFAMEKQGIHKLRIEGFQEGRWIVLDYGNIIVHLFHHEEREFYNIERLWKDESNSEIYLPTPAPEK